MTWTCQRDGDCCRIPPVVVMTHAERAALEGAATVPVAFEAHPDPGFVVMRAGPCPLYDGTCTVYAVRPYNCRRFACQRTDYLTQAFDQGPQTRADVRQLRLIQRRAGRWARAHGWTP